MANVLPVILQLTPNMTVNETCIAVQDILAKIINYCDYPTLSVSNHLKKNTAMEKVDNFFSIVFDMKKIVNTDLENLVMDYSNETEYPLLLSFVQSDNKTYLELNYDCDFFR
uniref:hypothetical protein n=1 Tax=Streptococcus salivarius TaxID=1304 RepID=UPI0015EF38F4|nr:hypothetical protein [Streptococcus salivarius]